MDIFKRPHRFRRYGEARNERGYVSIPHTDLILRADVQTMADAAVTTEDGTKSVQQLKVFCDTELFAEDVPTQRKADRLWFQNKWFDCQSSRLSDNTPLRHWTATFIQCIDQEAPPGIETDPNEGFDPSDPLRGLAP